MEIKDLMIGDWVYDSVADTTFKVYPRFFSQWYNKPEQFEATIQPVPLTAEILEKNWFKSDTNVFGLCDYELSERYILENRGDRFCVVKRILSYGSTFHMVDVKYVHQLQHALRLLGIYKTIEI